MTAPLINLPSKRDKKILKELNGRKRQWYEESDEISTFRFLDVDPLLWNSVTFQESVSKTSSDSGLFSKRPKYTADSLLI